MSKLNKKYNFKESEEKWQKYWQDSNIFKFDWNDIKDRNKIFSIDTPPPHVSGSLHMGHVFGYSQMDIIARFQRMFGKNVFYPVGFDDNGLPSERYVEKKINKKSKSMERQEFVKICDKEIQDAEQFMKEEFIKMNYSFDFDSAYRTISPTARKVSQMSFIDLYNKGLLYRKEEPIIWDVVDQTALAQTEAEDKEIESQMNYITFKLKNISEEFFNKYSRILFRNYDLNNLINEFEPSLDRIYIFETEINCFDGQKEKNTLNRNLDCTMDSKEFYKKYSQSKEEKTSSVVIMTTRPELLPACVALFAHPDDFEKYRGKSAITPLGVEVPILFDESVEKDKGTGIMMCCTFGDGADVEKYKKYNLPLKMIINEKGCLYFDNVPEIEGKYKTRLDGLFTTKAREEILNILEEEGKIAKAPEKIVHNVKVGERSKSPLEILVKNQWNIKVIDAKNELHKKASEIKWNPEWMENRIHSWIDGLSWNWCISRQRFFGVPVPCWYSKRIGEEGKVLLPDIDQLPVDPTVDLPKGYNADEVIRETDVFDTWMTSSVSPQLSMQGITKDLCCDKERFETLDLPFDLRAQGHDIIRTWAFCTITKALYHENTIPWKSIFVNGHCLASDGTKMSKSKGNGVDPIKAVERFGADAIRYWAGSANLGYDTPYSEDTISKGQKLITKLFNSAKFAELNFEKLNNEISTPIDDIKSGLIFETIDKWIISKTRTAIENVTKSFEKFDYSKALELIENLFWNDFCDNYLEIAKIRCYGATGFKYQDKELSDTEVDIINKSQQSGVRTIYYVFNAILKMFAPFVPTICDEIYSCIYENEFDKNKSISARGTWPKFNDFVNDSDAEKIGEVAKNILAEVRKYKSDKNISIKEIIDDISVYCDADLISVVEDLKNVCNVNNISFTKSNEFKIEF